MGMFKKGLKVEIVAWSDKEGLEVEVGATGMVKEGLKMEIAAWVRQRQTGDGDQGKIPQQGVHIVTF